MSDVLYHYTCEHRAPLIEAAGVLEPAPQPMLDDHPLTWLTDLYPPDRYGLGLTTVLLTCDRTEFRVTVDRGDAEQFTRWAVRNGHGAGARLLCSAGTLPAHWWVTEAVVPVLDITRIETQVIR